MGACTPADTSTRAATGTTQGVDRTAGVATAIPQPSTSSPITGHGFPASIEPANRYMFYLHGKIIEEVGLPAISPEFGAYEYAAILRALESHGFVVISELRSKGANADGYARRVVGQVDGLLRAGVPAGNITVVGASKGADIAATVSFLRREPAMNYVLIGTCHPDTVIQWKSDGTQFHGNVLAIRDMADLQYSGSCESLFRMSEGQGLGRHQEIVLQVGTGHGILFKPLDDWVVPTVEWAAR